MKTNAQIVGENLKKIRESLGFTSAQIAKAIGTSLFAYNNYEEGAQEIPHRLLEEIANLLGCEPCIFFDENIQIDNDTMVTAFHTVDLNVNDAKEITRFKEIVGSYLKMERIAQEP